MSTLGIVYGFVRPYRRRFLAAVVLTGATTVVALAPPMILREIVNEVLVLRHDEMFAALIAVFIAVPLMAAGLRAVNNYVITLMGARLVMDMRRRLYGHLQRLPLSYFDRSSTGMMMERLMGDVGQVNKMVSNQVLTMAIDVVACTVALGAMIYLNAGLAMIPLLFVPFYVLTHRYFRRRVREANERYRNKMDDISGTVRERLQSTALVKAFGQERTESKRLALEAHDAKEFGVQAYTYSIAFNTAATLQTWLARTGILLLGYYMVIQGSMQFGDVIAFTAYSVYLLGPAVRFAQISNMVEEVKVSIRRIGEVLDHPIEAADAPDAIPVGRLRGEVRVEGVSFHYDPDQPVLEDIDLHIPAGATVALVGHTGCGKTTLASLLYRFYEPQQGRITIDGLDIGRIVRSDLRRNLSLVPQDAVVFEGTVRENIAYGRPDASRDDVAAAARIAELNDVVAALPDGLDSKLGGEDAKLSVGQKQRLMIARAVLTDPAVLILDEATSSLDGESERALQDALDRVMAGRTCFVIAHRLSTIVNADLIVVMDAGQVLEVGTHAELLAQPDGHYRKLYLKQFAKVA